MLKRNLYLWVALSCLFSSLITGSLVAVSLTASHHPPAEEKTETKTGGKEVKGSFWSDPASDPIALFTAVLTAFTGLLAWVAYKQVGWAREEFLSTHRPQIIIHSVEFAFDTVLEDDDWRIGAAIFYVNKGSTTARIVSIYADITRRTLPLQSGITLRNKIPAPDKLEGGQRSYLKADSDLRLNFEVTAQTASDNKGAVICLGVIVYEDERGIRRETGFCRRLDAKAERWVGMDFPEYEFAY